MKSTLNRPALLVATALNLGLFLSASQAATRTWSGLGTDANWNTTANWGGTAPVNTDILIFSGTTQQNNTNNIANLSINGMALANGGFTLNGNVLALNGPLTNTAGMSTLALGVNVTAQNAVWNIAPGSELRFSGSFSNTTTANPLATLGFGGAVRFASNNCLPNRFFTLTSGSVIADSCVLTTLDGFRVQPPAGSNAVFQLTNNASFTIGSGGNLRLCQTATGGTSRVDVASGILNMAITSGAGAGDIFVGEAANTTTVFNQNGGLVEFTGNGNNRIAFANASASANGTYNLNGGTLLTKQIVQVTAGSPGGTFNFNGGTLMPTAGSTTFFQGVQSANVQAGGATIDTTNLNITIGQTLAGNGPLMKLGTGTLTLTGLNTYTGTTTVSNGTLVTTSSSFLGGGAITVAGNANLSVALNGTPLSASALSLGSSVTNSVTLDLGASPTPGGSPLISATTLNGTGTALININGSAFASGSYPLISFTTATGLSSIKLGTLPLGVSGSLVQVGNTLNLNVALVPKNLAWSGAVNGNWDTSTTNWLDLNNGNNPTNYAQSGGNGDAVTFDDSVGGGATTINVLSAETPVSMTVNNNNVNYTFTGTGKISGSMALLKAGTGFGTLSIGTSNDYTGGTTINAGVVYAGHNKAFGSGPLTMTLGTLASDSTTARTLSNPTLLNADTGIIFGDAGNTGTLTLSGGVNLGGSLNRTFNLNSDLVISSPLTNGAIAVKTGPGNLYLRGNTVLQNNPIAQQVGDVIVDNATVSSVNGWRLQCTAASGTSRLVVTNGGVLNISTGVNTGNLRVGLTGGDNSANNIADISGTVDLTLASGSLAGNNAVSLGQSGANAILYLRGGGLLVTRALYGLAPGNAEAHFMGGSMRALANDTGFIQGLTNAFMENGGLTIDTTNFSVTVPQALLASGSGGLTKQGTGALILTGANTYSGTTVVNAGKLVLGPAHAATGGITVNANATLAFLQSSPPATVNVPSVAIGSGANSALEAQLSVTNAATAVITNLSLGGTVAVNVSGSFGIGQFPLFGYGTISGAGSLVLGTVPLGTVASIVTNTPNKTIDLLVSSVAQTLWTGATNGNWDLTTTNWTFVGSPTAYAQLANVLFNDSAITPNVALATTLTPSTMVVSNRTLSYSFSGAGSLAGNMTLVKDGTNTMTLGTANTYSGATTVRAGTLVAGNATAFGSTSAGVTVQNGGSLDVNGNNLSLEPVSAAGSGAGGLGALINAVDQNNALRDVTLTSNTMIRADTTFGIRMPADTDPGFRGNGYTLTKVGTGQLNLNGGQTNPGSTIWDCDLGDIEILEGAVSFERRMMMGRITNNYAIYVSPGAGLNLFALNTSMPVPTKPVFMTNAYLSANGNNASEGSTFAGPITLNGSSNAFTANGGVTLTLNGNIGGAGSVANSGLIVLGGVNTYSGATTIANGTLQIAGGGSIANSASIDVGAGATFDVSPVAPWTLGANQTLGGNGTVNGSVQANGTVSPGASIGALTFNNDLTLAGTNLMELTKDGGLTNDVITVNGTLTYGGRLNIILTGATPLAVNDTFKLFNFGSAPAGSFIITLPSGYTWDTSQLSVDGTIQVTAVTARPHPGFTSVTVSGNSIVLSGTNATGTYILYSTTNVALPLGSWTPEFTNTFSGPFSFTNAINAPRKFYLLQ